MLIASGVSVYVTRHLDQIGPTAIAVAIGALAAACFVWVQLKSRAPLDDYIVLLGALLVSADFGFIESQWHPFGDQAQRHFLLLAILHAATAYWFESRAVLSLSIVALAAWLGMEQRNMFDTSVDIAVRAFVCAAVVAVWRAIDRHPPFKPLFDQFAINFAFWGALALTTNHGFRFLGLLITMALGVGAVMWGFRQRRELFIMYAFVYTIIAINIVVAEALLILFSTIAGIVGLFVIHVALQERMAKS